jgi:enamine deaminase RidA (YjgF/YER057c/UK114 family)
MIERHLVPGQPKPFSHYCHVVRADRHVRVSGAVGTRKDGSVPDSTVEQFRFQPKK